ncbi:hypothetical protein HDV00_005193 [Rhizophlyctis rosea]|nr:hypothetical protein HDV00_005193 [Rhizophlyctis rosea]
MLSLLKSITSRKLRKNLKKETAADLSKSEKSTTAPASAIAAITIASVESKSTPAPATVIPVTPEKKFNRKAKERALAGIVEKPVLVNVTNAGEKAGKGEVGKGREEKVSTLGRERGNGGHGSMPRRSRFQPQPPSLSRESSKRHSVAITSMQVPKPWMNDPASGPAPKSPRMRRPVSWSADLVKTDEILVTPKVQPSQWTTPLPTPTSELPPRMPSPPKSLNDSDRADSAVSMESPPSTPIDDRSSYTQSPAASKRSASDKDDELTSERDEDVPLFLVQQALHGQYSVGQPKQNRTHLPRQKSEGALPRPLSYAQIAESIPRERSQSAVQRPVSHMPTVEEVPSQSKIRSSFHAAPVVLSPQVVYAPPNSPYAPQQFDQQQQQQPSYPSMDTLPQPRRRTKPSNLNPASFARPTPDTRRNTTDFSTLYTYKQPQLIPSETLHMQHEQPAHNFTGQLQPREPAAPQMMIIPKTATTGLVAQRREQGFGLKSGPGGVWRRDERGGVYCTVGYGGQHVGQHARPGMPVGWM